MNKACSHTLGTTLTFGTSGNTMVLGSSVVIVNKTKTIKMLFLFIRIMLK